MSENMLGIIADCLAADFPGHRDSYVSDVARHVVAALRNADALPQPTIDGPPHIGDVVETYSEASVILVLPFEWLSGAVTMWVVFNAARRRIEVRKVNEIKAILSRPPLEVGDVLRNQTTGTRGMVAAVRGGMASVQDVGYEVPHLVCAAQPGMLERIAVAPSQDDMMRRGNSD